MSVLVPASRTRLALGLATAIVGPALLSLVGAAIGFPRVAFPALLYLVVVVVAVWLGRLAAGLLAALLSVAGLALFVFPPFGDVSQENVAVAAVLLLLFLATALVFAHLLATAQAARATAESAEERFRLLLEGVRDYAIFMLDADGRVASWNAGAEAITGYRTEEILGNDFSRFYPREDVERGKPREALAAAAHGRVEEEGWRVGKGGSRYWAHTIVTALRDESGHLRGFAEVIRDMTERKRAEEQLSHMALHDPLTALPNRALLFDRLTTALAAAGRGSATALLFVDLDRFKLVNDSLGHHAGDHLLLAVAAALRSVVREGDTVGRLAGDEFAVVCPDVDGRREAVAIGDRIRDALQRPFAIDGHDVFVSASVGVALTRGGNRRPELLVEEADAAMYTAKRRGRNRVVPFDERMRDHALNRVEMRGELRRALARGELTALYQPQLDLRSGRIVGAEALVRWRHPERGLLKPAAFIPVAEDVGLIGSIDAYVLVEACRAAKEWNARARSGPVLVSVNLSPSGLSQPGFMDALSTSLADAEVDLSNLCLEITEASLIELGPATASLLAELKEMGARIAIDDFGTGYSSLSYLAELPLDIVKIDSSFIQRLSRDSRTRAIVAAICRMARELGLVAVAEGVETAEAVDDLRALGCDVAQGDYVASPQTHDALAEMVADLGEAEPAHAFPARERSRARRAG